MTTPNPLTAAIEELLEKFEVISGDGQIRPLLRQAHALGKQEGMREEAIGCADHCEKARQEGMDEGAASERTEIIAWLRRNNQGDSSSTASTILKLVDIFIQDRQDAARTAHKKDSI